VNVKSSFAFRGLYSQSVCFLLIAFLFSSLFVGMFMINSSSGASLDNAVRVKNEVELKNAINNTPTGGSTTIALDNDITLTSYEEATYDYYNYHTGTLVIPVNKDITLTSNRANGFYKLIGAAADIPTILVGGHGVLRLDGIIVTHKSGVAGCGVDVMHGVSAEWGIGTLYLYSGEISGNIGVGVENCGTFIMSGGKISNNTAVFGGGVYMYSSGFSLFGGEISGNTARYGGGVCVYSGSFEMSGGTISGNSAEKGGGVYLDSYDFTMSGGKIAGNIAIFGGGVYVGSVYNWGDQVFMMSGGEITGNKAGQGGGVYNAAVFMMTGGTISGNLADGTLALNDLGIGWGDGGGVYHDYKNFTMTGGKITDNIAACGGGVFWHGGTFDRQGGVISSNIATKGDDVYHYTLRNIAIICSCIIIIIGFVATILSFMLKRRRT
jgi:hypothetical protein